MKHLALIWLACVLFAYAALSAPPPSFRALPDYLRPNRCEDFSLEAMRFLQSQSIPAQRALFGWTTPDGDHGFHAAVLFQWEGRFFYMDNQRQAPRPVAAKTDLGCVYHIVSGGFGSFQWMVDENNKRRAPRKMAELFPSRDLTKQTKL